MTSLKKQRRTSTALDDTFEQVMHQVSRSFSGSGVDFGHFAEEDELERVHPGNGLKKDMVVSSIAINETNAVGSDAKKKRDGFVGFVLEVWLWLQFAIVVCVFLWAMARRGPKSLLEDAERRKGEVQRATRR